MKAIIPLTVSGFRRVVNTIYNWREGWFWPLLAFLNWILLIGFAAHISGRRPQESMDFLVDLGANVLICVFAITLISILRESAGEWWNKEELKQNPHLAWCAAFVKAVALIAFLWALKH